MGLVTTQWLADHLNDSDVRICDVRWYLPRSGKSGAAEYAAGHIPGAIFVDLDHALAGLDDGKAGRHPLPSTETFVAAMRAVGISATTHVIAYDDMGGSTAARLWWLLRAHGHDRVSLLDGGLPAWKQEGRPMTQEVPPIRPGSFASHWNPNATIDLEGVRAALKRGATVLDARARDRYRGDTEPVDPRPGHIPGAVSAPFAESLDQGRFLPGDRLRARYEALAPAGREVVSSCGSGVTACHHLFGMDATGVRPFPEARLYVGSYSEWSRHPELSVATGD